MDYKKIGLISGIEIHQQLEGKKLFCSCPTIILDDAPDSSIMRELRAVEGETGKIDIAAASEQKKQKYNVYHIHNKNTCLVEIDEEPPHPVNPDALETALIVAKLLNARVVDEVQFMRKTVIDGSNVGGFQRTGLIATDGYLETSFGKVAIDTICLEEDSAKIINRHSDHNTYNLSRLGIPLVEIATGPDMRTPEQVQEVAQKIGLMLRSTGAVKRGLGTIRQDVNVSVEGGARVEIKGAQDLKMVPTIVENEAQRQLKIQEAQKKLQSFKQISITKPTNVEEVFKNTECTFLKKALKQKNGIFAVRIPQFAGMFGFEIMPNHRIGTDVSDKTKVATGAGIVHSDELPKFGITQEEVDAVAKKLGCKKEDAFVITATKSDNADRVVESVISNVNAVTNGVVSHVRAATQTGTSKFLRPMPGGARMYPETDVPTIPISKQYLDSLELPESLEEKTNRLKKMGLADDLAELIVKKADAGFFESCVKSFKNIKPAFIAETMLPKLLELKRKHNVNTESISNEQLTELFTNLDAGKITKAHVDDILVSYAKGKTVDYSQFKTISKDEVEKEIKQIIAQNKGKPFGAVMGMAMGKLRGKADGKTVSELLKKHLK